MSEWQPAELSEDEALQLAITRSLHSVNNSSASTSSASQVASTTTVVAQSTTQSAEPEAEDFANAYQLHLDQIEEEEKVEKAKPSRKDKKKKAVPSSRFRVTTGPVAASEDKHFYVIFSCRQNNNLIGVHHCSWPQLAARLPGGRLAGSGAVDNARSARAKSRRPDYSAIPQQPRYPSCRDQISTDISIPHMHSPVASFRLYIVRTNSSKQTAQQVAHDIL